MRPGNSPRSIDRDHLAQHLGHAETTLQTEADAHRQVVAERDRLLGRLQGLNEVIQRIEHRSVKKARRQQPLPFHPPARTG